MATMRRPAVRDTALLMPEAVPACVDGTALITLVVRGATVMPMPIPTADIAGK
jgi:hypothetical protein